MKNSDSPGRVSVGRAAVLDALRGQPDPVDVDALAHAVARHPNTVREHLNWLVERDLVVRVRRPSNGRGRPAWLYQARGERPGSEDYVELAAALAWQLRDGTDDRRAHALAAGRRWGLQLVAQRDPVPGGSRSPATGRAAVVALLDELGYRPDADAECDEVVLRRCPLLQAARRFPDVVCAVHLGLVQSVLEAEGADPDRAELTPFSAPGECRLRLLA